MAQSSGVGACVGADVHGLLDGAIGRVAFQDQPSLGLTAPFAKHDHRALGQQVGQVAWLHVVHVQAFHAQLHIGQYRGFDHGLEPGCLFGSLCGFGDDERLTHAGAGQAFHQVAVDAGANAERKHIGLGQVVAHQVKSFALHGHITIGHHHYSARHIGGLGFGIDALQGGDQLGAAATTHLVDGAHGLFDIGLGGWHRALVQKAVAAGEQQHVEGVAGAQVANQLTQQRLGCVQRKAVHGA